MKSEYPKILRRRPAPEPTESLFGYVLRLAQVNGYETIAGLLFRAGVKHGRNTAGFDVSILTRLTGRNISEFRHLSHAFGSTRHPPCFILSNPVFDTSLSLRPPKICPACVQEKGFIEAHFDLKLMVGCPIHRRELLNMCPECKEELSWSRPGLLHCKCGAQFSGCCLGNELPLSEIEILNCIRSKVLGEKINTESGVGIPLYDLSALELKSLLTLLHYLGTRWLVVSGQVAATTSHEVLSAASLVLSEWPHRFHELLAQVDSQLSGDAHVSFTNGPFARIYQTLQRWRGFGNQKSDGEFIRRAFKEFFVQKRAEGLVGGIMRDVETPQFDRYLSMRGFAELCQVSHDTVARRAKKGMVSSHRRMTNSIGQWAVDVESATLQSVPIPGKICPQIQTARILGKSKSVFRELVESGDFEVLHKVDWTRGYHEQDIQGFIRKFSDLASRNCQRLHGCGDSVSVRSLVFGNLGSIKDKANRIRMVLSGDIPIVGKQDETVGGILLPRAQSRRFLRDSAAQNSGARSQLETAELLQCSRKDVRALLDGGLLEGVLSACGLQIDADSLAEFASRYSCLAQHAKYLGTSCSALSRWCELAGMSLLSVKTSYEEHHRLFIQKKDVPQLKRFRNRERKAILDLISLEPDYTDRLAILPNRVTIRGLISQGFLRATKREKRWIWVEAESLIAFNQEYVPVTSVATESGLTTREAVRGLEERGISVVFTSTKNKSTAHAFIRASDRLALSVAA